MRSRKIGKILVLGLAAVFITGQKKYPKFIEETIVFNSLQEQEGLIRSRQL